MSRYCKCGIHRDECSTCEDLPLIALSRGCQYARVYYNVPAAIGRRVAINGRSGIIVRDMGHYIGVNFDDDKASRVVPAHPAAEVVYGEMGTPRKLTKRQQRYQRYLEVADAFGSFIEFCRFADGVDRVGGRSSGKQEKI